MKITIISLYSFPVVDLEQSEKRAEKEDGSEFNKCKS